MGLREDTGPLMMGDLIYLEAKYTVRTADGKKARFSGYLHGMHLG